MMHSRHLLELIVSLLEFIDVAVDIDLYYNYLTESRMLISK